MDGRFRDDVKQGPEGERRGGPEPLFQHQAEELLGICHSLPLEGTDKTWIESKLGAQLVGIAGDTA